MVAGAEECAVFKCRASMPRRVPLILAHDDVLRRKYQNPAVNGLVVDEYGGDDVLPEPRRSDSQCRLDLFEFA